MKDASRSNNRESYSKINKNKKKNSFKSIKDGANRESAKRPSRLKIRNIQMKI